MTHPVSAAAVRTAETTRRKPIINGGFNFSRRFQFFRGRPLLGIISGNKINERASNFFDCAELAGFLLGIVIKPRIYSARLTHDFRSGRSSSHSP